MRRVGALLIAAVLTAPPALAQETKPEQPSSPADMVLTVQAPTDVAVGDPVTMTVRIANKGPEGAEGLTAHAYLSDSIALSGLPSACSEDGFGGLSCDLGSMAAGSDDSLTFRGTRVRARDFWSGFSVEGAFYDPAYENNYVELYFGPDTSVVADLAVGLSGPRAPAVGQPFSYRLKVTNDGPDAAAGVKVVDSLPSGVEYVAASHDGCTLHREEAYAEPEGEVRGDYFYQELRCALGRLGAASSAAITIDVVRRDPYELWNSAWVSSDSYDPDYDNDYADLSASPDASVTSDLGATLGSVATTPLMGETFEVPLVLGNSGPASVPDAYVGVSIPHGLSFVSASSTDGSECSLDDGSGAGTEPQPRPAQPSTSETSVAPSYYGGTGLTCALGALGVGDSTTVTLRLTRTKAREQWIGAWLWSSHHDPSYDDNNAETLIAPDTSNPADVGLAMTAQGGESAGQAVTLTAELVNSGPSEALAVEVLAGLGFGLEVHGVTSSDPSDVCELSDAPEPMAAEREAPVYYGYRELRCDMGTLAPGESAAVTIEATRTSEYETYVSALGTTASYDPNYDNDEGVVVLPGERPDPCGATAEGGDGADRIADYDCPVEAGAGADKINVQADGSTRAVDVSAGPGRDSVVVNVSPGSDRLRRIVVRTGKGSDSVRIVVAPGAANAEIIVKTGPGNDSVAIDAPRLGRDLSIVVRGGNGADVAYPKASTAAAGPSRPWGWVLRGGPGPDRLVGAYGDDRIYGGGGRDTADGGTGNDVIDGGGGPDVCRGGPGHDRIFAC